MKSTSKIDMAIEEFDFREWVDTNIPDCREVNTENGEEVVRTVCFHCADHKPRLYLNLGTKQFFCHNCDWGIGLGLIDFLMEFEGKSRGLVISELAQLVKPTDELLDRVVQALQEGPEEEDDDEEVSIEMPGEIPLPGNVHKVFTKVKTRRPIQFTINRYHQQAKEYLRSRGVDGPLSRKYQLHVCYAGRYRGRIIYPAFMQGRVVSWVARTMADAKLKYLNPDDLDQGKVLWNFDNARAYREVILCEGVHDGLRVGDDAVATFGKNVTPHHIKLIESYWDSVVLLQDPDAVAKTYRVAEQFSIPVRIAHMDPGRDAGETERSVVRRRILEAPIHRSDGDFSHRISTIVGLMG